MPSARSTQRHRALDVVFEADFKGILNPGMLRELLSERQETSTAQVPIKEYGSQLVTAVSENLWAIDEILAQASTNWSLARMPGVDRSILRVAVAELLYVPTDLPVVVKEYSALARELSNESSIKFLTGVLNRVAALHAEAQAADNKPETPSDE